MDRRATKCSVGPYRPKAVKTRTSGNRISRTTQKKTEGHYKPLDERECGPGYFSDTFEGSQETRPGRHSSTGDESAAVDQSSVESCL